MRYLLASETRDGWYVKITDQRVVPSLEDVRDEIRYLNLKEKEVTILPLPKP